MIIKFALIFIFFDVDFKIIILKKYYLKKKNIENNMEKVLNLILIDSPCHEKKLHAFLYNDWEIL